MNKKAIGVRLHSVMVRLLPAIISSIVLIPMVPALGFLDVQDPVRWLGFLGFVLAGLVFVYDGLYILPDKKEKYLGLTASFVMFIIGGANILFSILIWFGYFNPFVGDSVYTPWATVTLALGVGALFVAGLFELIAVKLSNKEMHNAFSK